MGQPRQVDWLRPLFCVFRRREKALLGGERLGQNGRKWYRSNQKGHFWRQFLSSRPEPVSLRGIHVLFVSSRGVPKIGTNRAVRVAQSFFFFFFSLPFSAFLVYLVSLGKHRTHAGNSNGLTVGSHKAPTPSPGSFCVKKRKWRR